MDNILALDLGTTTGWAMMVGSKLSSGSVSFKPTHFDSTNSRYTKFRRWLETKGDCQFDDVVYEAVRRHNGIIAGQTYGGFMATLQMWCDGTGLHMRACQLVPSKNSPQATAMPQSLPWWKRWRNEAISSKTTTRPMRWLCCIGGWNRRVWKQQTRMNKEGA